MTEVRSLKRSSHYQPYTHYVQITGEFRINGKKLASIRAAELLHLVSNNGKRVSRYVIENKLYGGYCSRSSIWYPLKICQKAGIDIHYNRQAKTVVLTDDIQFDYDLAMDFLANEDLRSAIWVLNGWPLANQSNSYSDLLLEQLKIQLESHTSDHYWSEVEEIFEALDHKHDRNRNRDAREPHYSRCFYLHRRPQHGD
ncbi:hypothetical protein [Corynebacterium kozikiae]|uniref:hypothetical protein n=1 Tax=Corynebacterium kozikiae TaxID=2968469 RepID=UPI00211CA439|nr:hypothetical protein [Corynebacterium sp. 76QC2CO]MCQ9344097.1 hypothetical protein [Corynebacterium sp. 76QC2CO]